MPKLIIPIGSFISIILVLSGIVFFSRCVTSTEVAVSSCLLSLIPTALGVVMISYIFWLLSEK